MGRAQPTLGVPTTDYPDARILVVDDDPSLVRLLEIILSDAGYTAVSTTTDSADFSSLCTTLHPDVVLIDLHMPDPDVPYDESVGALLALRDEGLVRGVGVSNVDGRQLRQASLLGRIDAVQNLLAPSAPPGEPVTIAAELSASFVAYAPLSGVRPGEDFAGRAAFDGVADRLGVSVVQVALAWVLAQGPHVLALTGPTALPELAVGLASLDVQLTASELDALSSAFG